jgi:hypothetical protein
LIGWGVGVAVGVGMGVCVGIGAVLHPVIRTAAAAASRIHCAGRRSIRLRLVMSFPPIRYAGVDLVDSTRLGASIQHYRGQVNDACCAVAPISPTAVWSLPSLQRGSLCAGDPCVTGILQGVEGATERLCFRRVRDPAEER